MLNVGNVIGAIRPIIFRERSDLPDNYHDLLDKVWWDNHWRWGTHCSGRMRFLFDIESNGFIHHGVYFSFNISNSTTDGTDNTDMELRNPVTFALPIRVISG